MGSDNTFIEGVGDDIVYGLTVLTISFAPVIYMMHVWSRSRHQPQDIHPESEQNVQDARQHLQEQGGRTQPGRASDRRSRDADMTCPICLAPAEYAIETNCGHVFCGTCIVTYWKHGRWLGAVRCPVCRQQVTLLLYCFHDEEHSTQSTEKTSLIHEINAYNKRFSGEPRTAMEILTDLPTLLRHCLSEFFSLGGLILMFRLRVFICLAFAVLYLISPLDIIPEAAFGLLGFVDDFFVVLLLFIYISVMYRRVMSNRGDAE